MRTARAKGLAERLVLVRHAVKNSLIPIITMLGLQVAYMLGGAVVVENVFAWNGVGRLAVQAILQRDFPMIQGFVLMFAVIVMFGASYTLKRNEHVRVDILYMTLSRRGQLWIDILGALVFLLPFMGDALAGYMERVALRIVTGG